MSYLYRPNFQIALNVQKYETLCYDYDSCDAENADGFVKFSWFTV